MESRPDLWIDTDVGVDDAMALMIALAYEKKQKCRIFAISCVCGNVDLDQVWRNTARVLNMHKKLPLEIPVYKGCGRAILGESFSSSYVHGIDGLGDVPDVFPLDKPEPFVREEHAVTALIDAAKKNPGQLTVVALGPLTNIALAIRLDPQFTSNLKELVIMGGNIFGQGNISVCGEFNFRYDPEAANIVLTEPDCPVSIVSWEVCIQHGLSKEWLETWMSQDTDKAKFLKAISGVRNNFSKDKPLYTFCDELALAVVINPGIIKESEKHYATVELWGQLTRGQMVLDRRNHLKKSPCINIITDLNLDLFKDMLYETLL